jgi:hypothetical protein
LPAYASKYSRRDFTLPQLFALLVLRKFFRTDYRGVVALVGEWAELRRGRSETSEQVYATVRRRK